MKFWKSSSVRFFIKIEQPIRENPLICIYTVLVLPKLIVFTHDIVYLKKTLIHLSYTPKTSRYSRQDIYCEFEWYYCYKIREIKADV